MAARHDSHCALYDGGEDVCSPTILLLCLGKQTDSEKSEYDEESPLRLRRGSAAKRISPDMVKATGRYRIIK